MNFFTSGSLFKRHPPQLCKMNLQNEAWIWWKDNIKKLEIKITSTRALTIDLLPWNSSPNVKASDAYIKKNARNLCILEIFLYYWKNTIKFDWGKINVSLSPNGSKRVSGLSVHSDIVNPQLTYYCFYYSYGAVSWNRTVYCTDCTHFDRWDKPTRSCHLNVARCINQSVSVILCPWNRKNQFPHV